MAAFIVIATLIIVDALTPVGWIGPQRSAHPEAEQAETVAESNPS